MFVVGLLCQTEDSCIQCKHAKDGPYCVHKCPVVKYSDDNGICQDCHENCRSYGCTGPLNSVGDGACDACDIAVYDHDNKVTECLPEGSDCETGYFKRRHLPSTFGKMQDKTVGFCASFCFDEDILASRVSRRLKDFTRTLLVCSKLNNNRNNNNINNEYIINK